MPRVLVLADDGWVALDERVCSAETGSEHYCRQLAERIRWAVADAEQRPARLSLVAAGEREPEPVAA